MRASILVGVNEPLVVEDVTLDTPGPSEVHVKWTASGVCHSDLSVYNGNLPLPMPNILGHEGAGVIVAAGTTTAGFEPGDHVIGNFRPMCGDCFYCNSAQPYICEQSMALSMGRRPWTRAGGDRLVGAIGGLGTFAEESVVHEGALVKVPEQFPLEQAALIGCGVTTGIGSALFAARVTEGSTCVVIGCGGVGQSVLQGCRLAKAATIVGVDLNAAKRDIAACNGATRTVDPTAETLRDVVKGLTDGRGADYVFEVVGNCALQREAYDLTRPGGTCVWVGIGHIAATVELPASVMILQNKRVIGTIYGSANVRRDMATIIEHTERGDLDIEGMVSRRIGLDDINDAFAAMIDGDVIRSVVVY